MNLDSTLLRIVINVMNATCFSSISKIYIIYIGKMSKEIRIQIFLLSSYYLAGVCQSE